MQTILVCLREDLFMIIFHREKKELLFAIIFIDLFLFLEKSTLQYAENYTTYNCWRYRSGGLVALEEPSRTLFTCFNGYQK